jgi:DMSO/TMAO reductase YedYZ heme-binding membrane subunit
MTVGPQLTYTGLVAITAAIYSTHHVAYLYLEKDYTLVADLSADFEPMYLHPAHHADMSSMIGVIAGRGGDKRRLRMSCSPSGA